MPVAELAPVTLPVLSRVQLKVAPDTLELSPMLALPPVHILGALLVAVTVGIGLTVTVAEAADPLQPLALGVTVNQVTCGALVVLTNVTAILPVMPVAELVPVMLVVLVRVQSNVVPGTLLGAELSTISVMPPEQKEGVLPVIFTVGVGCTVTVVVNGAPLHVVAPDTFCGVTVTV